jgi:thymidylate synthase ThyX
MKIIDQSHEILSIPKNPLWLIEQSARTCYKSESKIGCSKKAHPQIRALMLSLLKELKERVPVVFDDIYQGE